MDWDGSPGGVMFRAPYGVIARVEIRQTREELQVEILDEERTTSAFSCFPAFRAVLCQ